MTAVVHAQHFTPSISITPSVAPTAGHLLTLGVASRGGLLSAMSGWTLIEDLSSVGGSTAEAGVSLFYRIAAPGDTTWTNPGGQNEFMYAEWDSGGTLLTFVSQQVAVATGGAMTCGGAIIPGTADPVLVVGVMARNQQNDTATMSVSPDAASTELDDWATSPSVNGSPGRWYGFLSDDVPFGSYTVGGTLTHNAANDPCVGVTAAFAMAGVPVDPLPDPDPYDPPSPGRAILEIYVSDPAGPRWDEALWDTGEWGDAGWVSITPWSIIADVSWGADRAEAGILHDQAPGTWVVETHDPDRVLDPSNVDSQFYPEITPGLPIRLLHHSRIIRQGEVTRAWYSHADKGGRINASDAIQKLGNAQVPEDTILSDTLRLRAIEAIEASAVDGVVAWPPVIGGDPALSPAPSGEFSAWDVIAEAAREVLFIPLINNGNRLFFRSWFAALDRGRVIGSPNIVDVAAWTSHEGLYSVVRAQEPGGALEERAATPTPAYGKKVYERTRDTINAEDWAAAVLADRRDASLRYVPGDLYPLTDADVAWMARLEVMEDVVLSVPQADPAILVTARILGINVRAVDETKQKNPLVIRTRWRWRLITAVTATVPLVEDGGDEFLYSDQDPSEPIYPDGA